MNVPFSRLTAAAKMCHNCSKALSTQGSRSQTRAVSTSTSLLKDEDEINTLKTNPYFDKYSPKISQLQKTSPEELIRRLATSRQTKVPHQPEEQSIDVSQTKKRSLDETVKMDLLGEKSREEITGIWLKHYIDVKNTIAIVIPTDVYNLILSTSLKHPTFLLPLPRKHGFEFFVSQGCVNEFHVCPLINYQAYKENAPECLALTYYTELCDEKGIVLVQGEFNDDILDISEAMCLTNQLHKYFGQVDSQRQKLLERFTHAPTDFCHMDLIVELERMAI